MFKSHPDNLSLQNLTARYVVALGLLAVTTTASMLYLYRAISEQQYYSNVNVPVCLKALDSITNMKMITNS